MRQVQVALFAIAVMGCGVTAEKEPLTIGAPKWHAQWIWGGRGTHGYNQIAILRKRFHIAKPLRQAWAQFTGDDSFQLFINGKLVKEGGFRWRITHVANVTKFLRIGENVIAARVHNAAPPGGFLFQLTIVYQDNSEQMICTDNSWRFLLGEPTGCLQIDFDDSAWRNAVPISAPPVGPWDDLPICHLGAYVKAELVRFTAPRELRAGRKYKFEAVVRCAEKFTANHLAFVRLRRQNWVIAETVAKPVPPTSKWRIGSEYRIGPMHLTVPLFLPGGEWQLEFGIYKVRLDDDGVVSQRVTVVPRKAKPSYCAVRMHNGAPTLFINGKPVFGMLFWGFRIDDYKRCNVHIYTVGVPLCWYKDKVDFTEADRAILQILSRDPQGFIIPRVYIGAPRWWCNAHEGELTRYADGVGWVGDRWGGTRHQSFASTLWLKEASQALRRFIAHMQRSPFADRIIGYHIANGIYGEWHYWSPIHLPDTSEPMRRAFITWCKRKYGTIERLNATWGTKLRNFDEIRTPDMNARLSADIGIFRDPKRSRWVIDYYQCFHETTANAIAHFCRVVKDATDGRAIVGAFYAYLPDLGWAMEGDHLAPAILFNEPAIDFFASPHSYARRALGQDGNFRAYPESIRLHGKLFFDEGDDRTHLAHGDPVHMHAKTRHESLQILWREFANVLTHHCAFWWMDQQLCWFHDEILQAAIRKMKRIGDESLKQQRKRVSQVAVLCSTSSFFYLINQRSRKERIMQPLVNHQIEQLYRMGAPFDVYIVEDLPRIPDRYRCYVLLNCFHLPRKLRDELKRRVRRDGRMLISFYAPGLIDDEVLDERNMFETTGIQLRLRDEPCAMRVILRDSPITRDVPKVTRIEFSDLEKPVRRREFDNIKNWLIGRRDEVLREYFETFTVEQVNDAKMGRAIRWCIKHIKSGQPSDVHVRLRFEKPIARIGVWVKNVSRKSVWFWVKFYEADRSEYRVAPKRLATDDEWHYYEFDVSEYMLAPWSHDENDKLDFPIVQITMVVPGTKLNEPYEFWFAGLTVTPARKVMVRHTASYAAWGNNPQFIAPTIFADDPKCQVLGTFVGCGLPAFVIKRFGEWTSVYSASPGVPWQILRELMRLAGVHVYVESGDNLYVDNRFIALHTVSGGVKRINLLKHATVRDLIHDRTIAVDASKFEIELPKFTTALFELL